jgi:divalent metal cation (Fe/Co/Zn/Cd) transporter
MVLVQLGFPILDPVLALGIAVAIAKIGFDIIRDSSKVLLDTAAVDVRRVEAVARAVPGVAMAHHIRSRGQEDDVHLDLHVQVEEGMPIEQAHHVAHAVVRRLTKEIEGVRDVVVHVEPQDRAAPIEMGRNERIRELAGRIPGAGVHSVQAHSVDGRLYVSLHLEVEPDLAISQAHDLADQLEDMLVTEMPEIADVEVHIEPAAQSDERARAADRWTRRRVQEVVGEVMANIGGLGSCHDLNVLRDGEELLVNIHCNCDPALTVAEAHTLSERLERGMEARLGPAAEITVHIEPRAE